MGRKKSRTKSGEKGAGHYVLHEGRDFDISEFVMTHRKTILIACAVALVIAAVAGAWALVGRGAEWGFADVSASDEAEMRRILFSGEPHLVFCRDERNTEKKAYKAAFLAFKAAARAVPSARAVTMDCMEKLPSGKTVIEKVGLKGRGHSPATVFVAANGRKPRIVAPSLLERRKLLRRFVRKAVQPVAPVVIDSTSDLRDCVGGKRGVCVIAIPAAGAQFVGGATALQGAAKAAAKAVQGPIDVGLLDAQKFTITGLPDAAAAAVSEARRGLTGAVLVLSRAGESRGTFVYRANGASLGRGDLAVALEQAAGAADAGEAVDPATVQVEASAAPASDGTPAQSDPRLERMRRRRESRRSADGPSPPAEAAGEDGRGGAAAARAERERQRRMEMEAEGREWVAEGVDASQEEEEEDGEGAEEEEEEGGDGSDDAEVDEEVDEVEEEL